jgi:NAD(P)-dependent dehydrogenase (short-subunit alcohol dehydrogenase family)
MNLADKRVAVTGGFGALGIATVNVLQAAGARVAAIDRANAPPAGISLGDARTYGGVDIGDAASAKATFAKIAEALGGLDALVNIAGTFRFEKIADGKLDTWDLLYNVNLRTAVAASQAALPFLIESKAASIVNIGAMGALKAGAGMGAYAASKAGIFKLTESLADELKEKDITVNAILPSTIDTPANRADMPKANFSHWVKPEQIADLIVFLLSGHARAITGALIPIAGRV